MDIKKTDIFSGIGVFALQLFINLIVFMFQKNHLILVISIVFSLIISVLVIIIFKLNKNIKNCKNNMSTCDSAKDDLNNQIKILKENIHLLESENDSIYNEMEDLINELEFSNIKCSYYEETDHIIKKILYALKNRKKCSPTELQNVLANIEYIFKDENFTTNDKINTSIFTKKSSNKYSIALSTRHSPGTIEKLILDDNSFVGAAFNKREVLYCGDLDNRKPELPFSEINQSRQYQSIIAIPLVIDHISEFVLIITCSEKNTLHTTYDKYKDVIQKYLELLGILIFLHSNKEE